MVGTEKPYGGIDSTPSFFLMSGKLDAYRPRLLTLKVRRRHKALDLDQVSRNELEVLPRLTRTRIPTVPWTIRRNH